MTPIPATDVLRILQRVAEGTAADVSFDDEMVFTLRADGWAIECFDDAGVFDGVYSCTAPDGTSAVRDDWDIDTGPEDLLNPAHADAIIRLREQWVERTIYAPRRAEQERINRMVFGDGKP